MAMNKKTKHESIHGNMLIIAGCGVLIRGKENMGKSELSLALIDRGHQLVCDDCVEVYLENNQLMGHCPKINNEFMHISGIGLIHATDLFGEAIFVESAPLQLAITLVRPNEMPEHENLLEPCYQTIELCQTAIPNILFPVHGDRNLALLIETVVRSHLLKQEGKSPSDLFHDRLKDLMSKKHDQKKD